MSGSIGIEKSGDGIVILCIDNPPANPIGEAMRQQLEAALNEVEADLSVRAVILTGAEGGFCAGDDLKEAASRPAEWDPLPNFHQFGRMIAKLESLRVPVIAAINGHAIGGGLELALACDIRVASSGAFFVAAAVNIGLVASVFRLPRLIGIGPAKAMLLTGNRVTAEQALRYGLVTEVHSPAHLMEAAMILARRVATRAPLSVEATKRAVGRAFEISPPKAEEESIRIVGQLRASRDHRHAVDAFLQNKTPKFTRS